jgi:sugar phosphate isomerase/epimerase
MLTISTLWMKPDSDIENWLVQVKNMGVDGIELGHGLKRPRFEEMIGQLEKHKIKVFSLHNFCPIPDDGPSSRHPSNCFRMSSPEEYERQQAVKWTKNTVDSAVRVGAKAVVIHTGCLDFEDERSPKLFELWKAGKKDSQEYKKELERILQLRNEKKAPYIEASEKSLKEVLDYSQVKKIQIGLETRYYPLEIPNFEEIEHFLNLYYDQGLGYWHDTGHAEVTDRLGITPHLKFLETYQDRMIGAHIHGIEGTRDHKAPFDGDLDLKKLLHFFKDDMVRVVEPKISATAEQVQSAISRLMP